MNMMSEAVVVAGVVVVVILLLWKSDVRTVKFLLVQEMVCDFSNDRYIHA